MKKILFALVAMLSIVACEQEPEAPIVEQNLVLTADNEQIYANGEQAATFTVKDSEGAVVEGATIYFANTHEALEGNSFKGGSINSF